MDKIVRSNIILYTSIIAILIWLFIEFVDYIGYGCVMRYSKDYINAVVNRFFLWLLLGIIVGFMIKIIKKRYKKRDL